MLSLITGMSRSNILLLVLLTLSSLAFAQRRPLRKPDFRIKTGQVDNIGRINYDPKTGDYILQWIGLDGKPKRATYVPSWKAILTVTATVRPQGEGFHYVYILSNAPNSPQAVDGFSLKISLQPSKVRVSNNWEFWGIEGSMVGKLARFSAHGRLSSSPLKPGSSLRIEFSSPFPPGVVKCYASGDAPLMRVPEELPQELEDRLPKGMVQEYLFGFTIAPTEKPSLQPLVSDWEISVKEGWVKDEQVGRRLSHELQRILRLVYQKRCREAQGKVNQVIRFAQHNRKLLEPEAQALIFLTLPYLMKRQQ